MKVTLSGTDTTAYYQEEKNNMGQTVAVNTFIMETKGKVIAYWTVTAALVFVMLAGAMGELTQQFGTLETHTVLGYPLFLLNIIGTWKILGVIAITVPRFTRLKEWAYAGMFFNMTGAFISHAVVGDSQFHLIYTGSVLLLVVASWALRPQSRILGKLSDSFGGILKRA